MNWRATHVMPGLVFVLLAAQPAAAQPAATPQTPQQTTATYEDWIVRCETLAGPPAQKSCEMVQFTHVKGQQAALTQIAIGRPVKGQPVKLVIQVPLGVWLPTGIRFVPGAGEAGLPTTFKRCVQAGCFADTDLKDDMVRKLRATKTAGKIEFKDAGQKDVGLPVSFNGFGAAYDALAKE